MNLQLLRNVLLVGLLWALLVPFPVWADQNVEGSMSERQVLEIVARHPEVVWTALVTYRNQQQAAEADARTHALTQVQQNLFAFIGRSPLRGNPAAPVTLIEFADFECPFCIQAHASIQTLLQHHPQVRFVFKHLPLPNLHNQALPAARAVWAAGQQGKFWPFYDALFAQREPLGEDYYGHLAQQLGLNLQVWERDRSSAEANLAIDADLQQAKRLGITGTPTFLVVGPSGITPVVGADLPGIESEIGALNIQTVQ